MDWTFLATVNASLNLISFVFLMFGYRAIKRGQKEQHRNCMISAGVTTLLFLTSYLFYHSKVGDVPFKGTGPIRFIYYYIILIPHLTLAATNVVLVIITFRRAYKQDWERHKKIAKITFPIWVYVSITGMIVYVMVYHLYK
ncbi:MAG TPA: DUF420 domain-containing protein [Planctomycetota bacterium]|nr:DUF420 domain-containing protein [Planctomycetota bacterium]